VSGAPILIVDDYPENLLALEATLQGAGHEVVRANSGEEALKAILAQDFALVLMDVAMPEMDGYETATLIRGRERSRLTPIIFLTANNKADAQVFHGYSVGAVDYMVKPFVPEVLLSKVAVFVELYTSRETLKRQAAALKDAYDEVEERVQARTAELNAARLEAESMNRLKDEFLGTLSHELRTPLNAILGWTHILEMGGRDEATIARGTRVIKNNALLQSQLVDDILDVSRIIGGKLHLKVGPVDLPAVIQSTLETLHPAAESKAITVTVTMGECDTLHADQARLQQVMWNLLSNAIKFTPNGGQVRLDLTCANDEVQVVVADNGDGIAADFLPLVFDRFRQADSSFSRPHNGLGLGLAIVRHLVELHGGRVTVASPGKGHGATFTVTLPLRAPDTDNEAPAADSGDVRDRGSNRGETVELPSLAGVTVLLVDDDPDAREMLTLVLQDRGADVTAAPSAAAGLAVLRSKVPDVIVSDIGMPGEDGHAFIRKVRRLAAHRGGDVPAVALTAYATSADAANAVAAGFNRHITKPIVADDVVRVVASLAMAKNAG
jgi:signal transduction histidine kinase